MATQGGNIGLWVMDIAGRHVWATQKTRDIFNFGQNEALNYDSFNDHILEQDRDLVDNSMQAAIETKDAFEVEFQIGRTDGSTCWAKARGKVYCDDDSQPKHVMGTTIDISSQKELEQQLVSKINEIQTLKQKLEQENALLHQQIDSHFLDEEIIARSKEMNHVLSLVEQVALTDATKEDDDLWNGIAGIRGSIFLGKTNWFIPFEMDIGAGDVDLTWQIFAALGYSFSDRIKAMIGFRHIEFEDDGNRMIEDLSMSGPAIGFSFNF